MRALSKALVAVMNQSLDAPNTKFHSKPLCKEDSWDFSSAEQLQYAFYVQRHIDCDKYECRVDERTTKTWRHDPGQFGLKYKPGHTEPVYAAAEKAETSEMSSKELTQLLKSVVQSVNAMESSIRDLHRKQPRRRKHHEVQACIEEPTFYSSEDESVDEGSEYDFYELYKLSLNPARKIKRNTLEIKKWSTDLAKSSL